MNLKLKNKARFLVFLLTPAISLANTTLPDIDIMKDFVDTEHEVLDTELDELTDVDYLLNVGKQYPTIDIKMLLEE